MPLGALPLGPRPLGPLPIGPPPRGPLSPALPLRPCPPLCCPCFVLGPRGRSHCVTPAAPGGHVFSACSWCLRISFLLLLFFPHSAGPVGCLSVAAFLYIFFLRGPEPYRGEGLTDDGKKQDRGDAASHESQTAKCRGLFCCPVTSRFGQNEGHRRAYWSARLVFRALLRIVHRPCTKVREMISMANRAAPSYEFRRRPYLDYHRRELRVAVHIREAQRTSGPCYEFLIFMTSRPLSSRWSRLSLRAPGVEVNMRESHAAQRQWPLCSSLSFRTGY